MIIEPLNNNVTLVELTGEEMKSLDITYEMLNNGNEATRLVLKRLIRKIDSDKRMSKGERVLVEAIPTENGGCFFIFTFTDKRKIRYKVKNIDSFTVFRAESIDDFLDFVKAAKLSQGNKAPCQVFKLKNNYYIYFPEICDRICQLMTEYGERSAAISLEWLTEHCESLGTLYLQ